MDIIVGLDIGSDKITAVITEVNEDQQLEVIGTGVAPSKGIRRGVVVNLEETVQSIKQSLDSAELMAGVSERKIFVGIAGDHIKSINSRGVIFLGSPGREITKKDVERVNDSAKAVSLPFNREVLHVLPREYSIDSQDGIQDPIGMVGSKLESEVHLVTGMICSAQNIIKSVAKAGYNGEDIVLNPLATSYSVLTQDEKEMGVVLIDIGGGTTDIALFVNGSIWYSNVIVLGGYHITRDLSIGLRTPIEEAEKLKIKYGCEISEKEDDKEIKIKSLGSKPVNKVKVAEVKTICRARIREILEIVGYEIVKSGFNDILTGGIVITGGTANLKGILTLAEEVMKTPVKIGVPGKIKGPSEIINNPKNSTAFGIALYGLEQIKKEKVKGVTLDPGGNLFKLIKNKFKEMVLEKFF